MHFFKTAIVAWFLSAGAVASPVAPRQYVGYRANEYTLYGCRPVIFFFARATTEVGNLVISKLTTNSARPQLIASF